MLIPYVDKLTENIQNRFTDKGVSVIMAMSVFNPASLPQADDPAFRTYGQEEITLLAFLWKGSTC